MVKSSQARNRAPLEMLAGVMTFVVFIFSCNTQKDDPTAAPDPAIKFSDVEIHERCDSLNRLAALKQAIGESDSSLYYLETSLKEREGVSVKDHRLADHYMLVGVWYYNEFKFETADTYFEKARLLGEQYGSDPFTEISQLIYLASCKREMKDVPTAKSFLFRAIDLLDKRDLNNDSLLAKSYNVLGSIYYVEKNYAESIKNLEREIAFLQKSNRTKDFGKAFSNLSMILTTTGEFEKALQFANKAVHHDIKSFGRESDRVAISSMNKGTIFLQLRRMDSARFYFYRNLEIRKKLYGDKHANTFGAYLTLSHLYFGQEAYDSALLYSQKCLVALIRNFNALEWAENPRPLFFETNSDLIGALVFKASILEKLFARDSIKTEYLQLALETNFLADSIFNVYRKNSFFDDPQLAQMEEHLVPYGKMIAQAFYLFDRTNDPAYFQKAFNAMERSRAILVTRGLQRSSRARTRSSNAIFDESQAIKQRTKLLFELSKPEVDSVQIDSLNNALLLLNDRLISLSGFSDGARVMGDEDLPIAELKNYLGQTNSVLVEFQWSDDKLFGLFISADSVVYRIIPITERFQSAIGFVRKDLKSFSGEKFNADYFTRFCDNTHYLFQNLLQVFPIRNGSEIIISADGPLASFPFEVLITEEAKGKIVSYQLPYLVRKHAITYALSAGLHVMQSKIERQGNKLLALGYGEAPPVTGQDQSLPGTKVEISSIAESMDGSGNRFYMDKNASENVFKKEVSGFNLIHLAVHGLSDTVNALNSKLVFNTSADSVDDGNLFAHELFDLDLSGLDMAVLSACESGVGKLQPGEGLMSIARGFAYSGCPTVVLSLWKIDDRISASLMKDFYDGISDRQPVNHALTEAKLNYLSKADEFTSHPSYWAAFISFGNNEPIYSDSVFKWSYVLAFAVLLLPAFGWFYYRKSKRSTLQNRSSLPIS